jgi:hypothetical protein
MSDRYRTSIQYRWSSFTNLVTPESNRSRVHEPSSILVGMVRNLYPSRYSFYPRHLGIPTRQLPMGIRSHHPPDEEEYRYIDKDTLLCPIHQSFDYRIMVYGKEYGGLGGRYGYHRYHPITCFLWNWYSIKGESMPITYADGRRKISILSTGRSFSWPWAVSRLEKPPSRLVY